MRLTMALYFPFVGTSTFAEPLMELIPLRSTGAHTINGNEIIVPPGGVTVELGAFVSGWAPVGVDVLQAVVRDDGTGITGGASGSVTFSRPLCTGPFPSISEMCAQALGVSNGVAVCGPDMRCLPALLDTDRPDWIFRNALGVFLPSSPAPNLWSVGGFTVSPPFILDDSSTKYIGTLVFEVSPDATGTFRVDLNGTGGSLIVSFLSSNGFIFPSLSPAFITIGNAYCGYGVVNQPSEECEFHSEGCSTACITIIPTVSEWGLVILTLVLLVASKIVFGARRSKTHL